MMRQDRTAGKKESIKRASNGFFTCPLQKGTAACVTRFRSVFQNLLSPFFSPDADVNLSNNNNRVTRVWQSEPGVRLSDRQCLVVATSGNCCAKRET